MKAHIARNQNAGVPLALGWNLSPADRGKLEGMGERANARIIKAFVPLAEMFGYATDLRSRTSGRASYSMTFSHYEEVPRDVAEKLLKK